MRKCLLILGLLSNLLVRAQSGAPVILDSFVDQQVSIARGPNTFYKGLLAYPSKQPITGYIFQNIEGFEKRHQSPVEINNKMGVIDTKGKLVVPCMYDKMIVIRAEGMLYYIVSKNGRYGVVNEKNEVVVPFAYSFIDKCNYMPSVIDVSDGAKKGLMNVVSRKWVAPAIYDRAWVASATTVKVMKGPQVYSMEVPGNKIQAVLPLQTESKMIATGREVALYITAKDGKYGLTDANGKVIVPLEYELITYPYVLTNLLIVTKNGKKGLLSLNGKVVEKVDCDELTRVLDDLYLIKRNGKYGVLNKEGVWLLPATYDLLTPAAYSDNYSLGFFVGTKNGKKGVVEATKNKQHVEYLYDDLIGSGRNYGGVEIYTDPIIAIKGGKCGIISQTGTVLLPFAYEELQYVNASLAIARKNGKYGVVEINNNEHVVVPFEYEFINYDNKVIAAYNGNVERYRVDANRLSKIDK